MINVHGTGVASVVTVLSLLKNGFQVNWIGGLEVLGKPRVKLTTPYGVAYNVQNRRLILNVEVKNMGIPWADMSFLDYMKGLDPKIGPNDFVWRGHFKNYVELCLTSSLNGDEKLILSPAFSNSTPSFKDIICPGVNFNALSGCVDPWTFDYETLKHQREVLIYGSGLTAIDCAIQCFTVNPELRVIFASRNMRMPMVYEETAPLELDLNTIRASYSKRAEDNYSLINELCSSYGWQGVFNFMRHEWNIMWSGMPVSEQTRFMKKYFNEYNVYRHRVPKKTMDFLNVHDWKLEKVKPTAPTQEIVFNATGINTIPSENRLISILNRLGDLFPYSVRDTGLVEWVTPSKDRPLGDCKVGPKVWCVGGFLRGGRLESTAMPDIYRQVQSIQEQLNESHPTRRASGKW